MESVESFVAWIQGLPPVGLLLLVFFIAYIENIFPPSPSDVLLVMVGALTGRGAFGLLPALIAATAGGTLGFLTAYAAGRYFEQHLIEGRWSRFLPVSAIYQVESLFRRYGYGVILANRFLAGTRAAVSFFAGMSRMNLGVTTILCAVGSAIWNAILLYIGLAFASNWRRGVEYLRIYSKVATIIALVAIVVFIWYFLRWRRTSADTRAESDRDLLSNSDE
jgi:membrane protein DedA with SNARE-associated domain